jgi:hypothetical protein
MTRKFDDDVVKQAVFGLQHEPPSNCRINRTTWIMPDLIESSGRLGWPRVPT